MQLNQDIGGLRLQTKILMKLILFGILGKGISISSISKLKVLMSLSPPWRFILELTIINNSQTKKVYL